MLLNLHVKNIALIDEVEIDFGKGLNILTGETGAGKSLIIDSVNFALGKRMPRDVIRDDSQYALCELIFSADSDFIIKKLEELDIPMEDGEIIIQRKLKNGRNSIRINGETASASTLKELSSVLIDIHGQHEHQSLLYKSKHKEILDGYCGDGLSNLLDKIRLKYNEYIDISNEYENAGNNDLDKDKEVALARFEIDEIIKAAVKEGEAEQLEAEYRKLSNARKIAEAVGFAHRNSGYDDDSSAGALVGRALSRLKSVSEYDDNILELVSELSDIDGLLNDFNRSVAAYEDELDASEEKFAQTEERLNVVNHIRSRYGNTVTEIEQYLADKQRLLEKYSDYDAYLAELNKEYVRVKNELEVLCEQASKIRNTEAVVLAEKIKESLVDLNFLDVRFEISVTADREKLSADGFDTVEFMISTNPGEKIRPLTEVASGGELSRIMLALKSVLADRDNVETLIFDEIDTGISGRTAQKVSEKLKLLSKKHQIICITHLPQIAAMADDHFEIHKAVDNDRTRTNVVLLEEKASVNELARMIGGVEITQNVIESAKEMKRLANNVI
ncbi:MAG: DNA repair protein RecN [Lachnospiraceae bacterium]|nr:DNA repair protein RecN [Lachnospiraceae bacterium]